MDFEFLAGFGPIGADPVATHTFWAKTLGIPLEEAEPGYFHTFDLAGTKGLRRLAPHASGPGDLRDAGMAGRSARAAGLDRVRGFFARCGRGFRCSTAGGWTGTAPGGSSRSLGADDGEVAES